MLVVLTGLPGTGKSTIAAGLGRRLPALVLSADTIDDALRAARVANPQGKVGFEIMKALAAQHLAAGQHVVVDAVNPFAFVRDAYATIADEQDAPMRVIVTTCSDPAEHRRRVEARQSSGEKPVGWERVEERASTFERFDGEALRLDALAVAAENLDAAIDYCAS